MVSRIRTAVEVLMVGSRGGFWISLMPQLAGSNCRERGCRDKRKREDRILPGFLPERRERLSCQIETREDCQV